MKWHESKGETAMYLKLAIRNARRSLGDYLLYIANMIIMLSIMEVSNYIAIMGKVQAGFQTASLPLLITLIMIVLVIYINQFMLKQRAKEFANYLLLGMEKNKLTGMFLCEFFIIGFACFIISAGIGLGICAFWGSTIIIFVQSLLQTFFYFCMVEVLSAFCIKRNIDQLQIRELMEDKKRNQTLGNYNQYRIWGIAFTIILLCLIGIICGIVYLPNDSGGGFISVIAIPLLLSIFTFYKWFFQYLGAIRHKQSNSLYENNRLYILGQITSGLKTNAIMNAVFSICLLFSAMSFIFGMFMLQSEVIIFDWDNQKWMGFLQISICIIFMVIYFSILSLQQIIELKREGKSIQILYYMGKNHSQVKALVKIQIAIQLLLPTMMCLFLLFIGTPFMNYKLNSILPATMSNILIKYVGLFGLCFVLLYLCYFVIVCAIGKKYCSLQLTR